VLKTPVKQGGCGSCRSPPVCFSGPRFSSFSRFTFLRGNLTPRRITLFSRMSRMCWTIGDYPRVMRECEDSAQSVRLKVLTRSLTTVIGWPEGKGHFAQRSLPEGYNRGFPRWLSNLYVYSPRESRQLCAEGYNNCHTFRVLRGIKASHPGESPTLSPGPLLPTTDRRVGDVQTASRRWEGGWGIPRSVQ